MSLLNIGLLSLIEIFGDFQLKSFADTNKFIYLVNGIAGYIGVVFFLVKSLRHDNVLYVNGMWDGISGIFETIAAYVLLGDRLTHMYQYIGLGLIVIGTFILRH